MGLLQRLLSRFQLLEREATISILGPSQAGKTTLVRYLETGETVEENPLSTLGVDYRSKPVKISSFNLNLIDVGGQKLYQDAFWDFAIEQSNAIIYVIDALVRPSVDPEKFESHLMQFQYALDIMPEDTVLMVLLNKQDLVGQNPVNTNEFLKIYPMNKLQSRTFTLLPTSAKYGQGVEEAFEWFVEAISHKL